MDYRAYLFLEGGDERTNESLRNTYAAIRTLKDKIIKDAKLDLYHLELKMQLMIEDLPTRAYNPANREQLSVQLMSEYNEMMNMVIDNYFEVIDKFEDTLDEFFPNTKENMTEEDDINNCIKENEQ